MSDFRLALRSLRANPGFTAAVVLTLALGIGANTTMFGVLDTLLLKPPALVQHPGRVHRLYLRQRGQAGTEAIASFPAYESMRTVPAFSATAASYHARLSLGHGVGARPVDVTAVTASYFPLLGVRPALGRFFDVTEDRLGASPVAVVGYGYWRRQLHGDPAALGRTLPIGQFTYTVVGVAPEGFTGADLTEPDIWLPLETATPDLYDRQALTSPDWFWIQMLVRLAPGTTAAVAEAQATAAYLRTGIGFHRASATTTRVLLGPIQEARRPGMSDNAQVALWIGAVALAVLLVACANVANLLLARGLRRRREMAVRVGLGAGRTRLVRQLLVESVTLALAGGVAGLLVALWAGAAARAFLLPRLPTSVSLLEPRLLLFTAGMATLAGVLAGSAPAWQTSHTDVATTLRAGGRDVTTTRGGLRSALLATQVALTLGLLVGAGLFVRSLRNAERLDYGLDLDHLLIADVEVHGGEVSRTDSPGGPNDPQSALYLRLLQRIQSNPAVTSAAVAEGTPYDFSFATNVTASGSAAMPTVASGGPYFNAVSADYFPTVGTRIVQGRGFTAADEARSAPPVTVVGQTFARLAWPNTDPIGQCLYVGDNGSTCVQVIGVAADARSRGVREDVTMLYYLPFGRHLVSPPLNGLLIRTRAPATLVAGDVQRALQAAEPDLPYVHVESLGQRIAPQWRSWRLGATMFSAFGLLALVIAALGLYAVTAYGVTQRTQEIGVRMALGAQRGDVVKLAVSQAMRASAAGAAAGMAGALVLSRAVRALLFEVTPGDPVAIAAAVMLLFAVAAAAAFIPARRAAHVDPMEALRYE